MFQLINAFDGDTARGTYFVYFYTGVCVIVQYQFGCSFYGLGHHPHGILGVNSHFYAGLHGSLNIFQYIGNAAGSHGSASCEFFFRDKHGESHLVEDIQHQLLLFFGSIAAGNQSHTFHFADGSIGNDAEHGHFRFRYVVSQFFEVDACGDRNNDLLAFQFQFTQYAFDKPRFHSKYDKFGTDDGFLIVMRNL